MSAVAALTSDQTAWVVTLAVGLVVALVVWALLEALRRAVNDVHRNVDDLWMMGKRVAQNTSTSHMLEATKARGGDVLTELQRPAGPQSPVPERSDP